MMRRGFWLAAGAVLGISGYRRATRLARVLTGNADDHNGVPIRPRQPSPVQLRWRSPLALTMRTPGRAAGSPGAARLPAAGRAAKADVPPADRIASAAGFVRDVQQGMAEYRDLHRGETDRTLGSQHRTSSGASDQGRREP